jgi:hypothetical protein
VNPLLSRLAAVRCAVSLRSKPPCKARIGVENRAYGQPYSQCPGWTVGSRRHWSAASLVRGRKAQDRTRELASAPADLGDSAAVRHFAHPVAAMAEVVSRPAQASLTLRPAGLLSRPKRPLSRGSSPAGYPAGPLVSYQINRQLSGWNLPPLVIRAFGAHCQQPT